MEITKKKTRSKTIKKRVFMFSIISVFIFIIFSTLAMILYNGGNTFYPDYPKYDFFSNFFSDLGRTKTFTDGINQPSCTLFIIALISSGIALMLSMIFLPSLFPKESLGKKLSILGSISGIIAGISYIGIALTPWNLYLDLHMSFVHIAFSSSLPLAFFYARAILCNSNFKNIYGFVLLFLGISLILYLILLFGGPSSSTESGKFIQVVGQKLIVYIENICFSVVSFGGMKVLENYKMP